MAGDHLVAIFIFFFYIIIAHNAVQVNSGKKNVTLDSLLIFQHLTNLVFGMQNCVAVTNYEIR